MRTDSHTAVVRADVRGTPLLRHGAIRVRAGRAFAISTALSPPRLWERTNHAVLDAFAESLERTGNRLRPDPSLEMALTSARVELDRLSLQLVEHRPPDASLLGLILDAGMVHVLVTGPGRVYVHRRGTPVRLTPREHGPAGLRDGKPIRCEYALEPGDLVLAGSVSAFSANAIAQVVTVLEADPRTSPSTLATLLTEPAAAAGIGAAAIALRVR